MINNDDKCDDTDAYKPNKTDDVKLINDHLQVSILLYLTILEICLNRDKYLNLQQKSFQNNVETLIDKYLYCIFLIYNFIFLWTFLIYVKLFLLLYYDKNVYIL